MRHLEFRVKTDLVKILAPTSPVVFKVRVWGLVFGTAVDTAWGSSHLELEHLALDWGFCFSLQHPDRAFSRRQQGMV